MSHDTLPTYPHITHLQHHEPVTVMSDYSMCQNIFCCVPAKHLHTSLNRREGDSSFVGELQYTSKTQPKAVPL